MTYATELEYTCLKVIFSSATRKTFVADCVTGWGILQHVVVADRSLGGLEIDIQFVILREVVMAIPMPFFYPFQLYFDSDLAVDAGLLANVLIYRNLLLEVM
jgi:hypothetical protein